MSDAGTAPALYAARPTIRLDGQDNGELTNAALEVVVEETVEGMVRFEAAFGNWGTAGGGVDFLFLDRQLLDFGKSISVRMGTGDAEAVVFDGAISGLEGRYPQAGPPEISVLAEDRFQNLRMVRRTRSFEDISDGDVISRIASDHGLTAQIDVNGTVHKHLAQLNQSDLAFIRERARAVDAEVWVEGSTLHASARSRRNAGQVTLSYQKELREFSLLADLANQRTAFIVSGWDVAAKEGIRHEAGESAISSELHGKKSGSSILLSAFGKRTEQIVHQAPLTQQESQVLAEAYYRRMARKFVTGQCIADGDGRIRVGTQVELRNVGSMFEGSYYVTEARHTFDWNNGYLTTFRVERAGIG